MHIAQLSTTISTSSFVTTCIHYDQLWIIVLDDGLIHATLILC